MIVLVKLWLSYLTNLYLYAKSTLNIGKIPKMYYTLKKFKTFK